MAEIRLRPIESDDVGVLAQVLSHPDLVGRRGLDGDRPGMRSVTSLVASLEKAADDLVNSGHGDAWVIETDAPVGLASCGWWWDAHTPWANVVIDPGVWRQGHGTAAARLVADHLFSNTVALMIEYSVPSWDADGLSFADSLGGERAGIRRRSGIRSGRYHDTVEFHLQRTVWEIQRAARG